MFYYNLFNDNEYYENNILENINNKHNVINILILHSYLTNLPNLEEFINLEKLECKSNQLKQLPKLPNNLKKLYIINNNLTELPQLPNNLEILYCKNNQLKELPILPINLLKLNCENNQLTQLPDLPNNLNYLYCNYNKLTELPKLPINLLEIHCYYNKLTELPILPNSLNFLNCNNNQLTQLPDLTINLNYLYCKYNKLTKLPELSYNLINSINLKTINCYNNSKNLHKYIIQYKSLYYYKKYNKYRYIDTLNELLNYTIENYYYLKIIKYYDKIYCKF